MLVLFLPSIDEVVIRNIILIERDEIRLSLVKLEHDLEVSVQVDVIVFAIEMLI